MSQIFRTSRRAKRGSALVEMALVIPLFLLVIGGVFEVSRIYYIQNTLEYGVKEAARIGASIRESVDGNFMSKGTISKTELENLITNSVVVMGVIEEPAQFMIKYLNSAGNELTSVPNDIPFDRATNPNAVDFVSVEITYPGTGANVNKPIPAVFNPANAFPGSITLMSRAIFQIEGRFER